MLTQMSQLVKFGSQMLRKYEFEAYELYIHVYAHVYHAPQSLKHDSKKYHPLRTRTELTHLL